LTISKGKSPNLYLIDLNGKIVKQLTYGNNIDTSPYFSPNKKNIVFVSDRPGYPQLYIMDIDGTNLRRIYTDGYSDSPSWSPQGDKIVFTMRQPGMSFFDIYLYDISGGKISQLTFDSGSNESPSFSPDGRFIVFSSTRNKKKEIFVMFVDGSLQYRLFEAKGNCYMPHWSP
ncbi:MAG: DPP IV N-terminal domain-containing protein, partial [Endomicrobiia bacterium]